MQGIMRLYENCATQRLFLPWLLPDVSAAVYMDTDVFFMRPPEELLDTFHHFNNKQVFGAVSINGYYLQENIEVRMIDLCDLYDY